MMIFRTWRFAPRFALAVALALFVAFVGCNSDDEGETDSAQLDQQQGAEEDDPGSDIVVADVVLPVFHVTQGEVLEEEKEISEIRGEGTEEEYVWRRYSIRVHSNYNPDRPENGGWEFNGPYIEYYRDFTVQCQGAYADGERTGPWVWNNENGQRVKEAAYENGLVTGTVTYYRPEDGSLERIESYQNGEKHGRWVTYAEDGETVLLEANYNEGAPEGLLAEWYPSGNKRSETHFVDGRLHGRRMQWYDAEPGEEQQVALIQHYTNGKPDGHFAQFSPTGTQLTDIEYKDGERIQQDAG